jgi:hypothetical protein
VKKLMCYLLIVWLALMSGGANAHAAKEAAHEASHTHDHPSQKMQSQSAALDISADAVTAADVSHTDTCNQSHCGHGHATGMLTRHNRYANTDVNAVVPTSRESWASSSVTSNIERPKWIFTTPAVVSLLS